MSAVGLYRFYNPSQPETETLEDDVVLYTLNSDVDARDLIKTGDIGQYYIDEMVRIFQRDGFKKYLKIDIWDNPYLIKAGVEPKIPLRHKILHTYLRKTHPWANKTIVRLMDRILKVFI